MEDEAWMFGDPFQDVGVLVSGIIIDDDMYSLFLRHSGIDGIEEANELLMAMALHIAAHHGSVEHVHRRKQGRRPVPLVVMGHGSSAAFLERQAGLGSVERLDLALFVDAEHDGAPADRHRARQCRAACRRTRGLWTA